MSFAFFSCSLWYILFIFRHDKPYGSKLLRHRMAWKTESQAENYVYAMNTGGRADKKNEQALGLCCSHNVSWENVQANNYKVHFSLNCIVTTLTTTPTNAQKKLAKLALAWRCIARFISKWGKVYTLLKSDSRIKRVYGTPRKSASGSVSQR